MATHYGPYPTLSEQDIQDAFERGDCIVHESGDVDILIPLYEFVEVEQATKSGRSGIYFTSEGDPEIYFLYGPNVDTLGKRLFLWNTEMIVYEAPQFNNKSLTE